MLLDDEYFEQLKKSRKPIEERMRFVSSSNYAKEAVLKVAKPKNLDVPLAGYRTKLALDYISRDGTLELENELGEKVTGEHPFNCVNPLMKNLLDSFFILSNKLIFLNLHS